MGRLDRAALPMANAPVPAGVATVPEPPAGPPEPPTAATEPRAGVGRSGPHRYRRYLAAAVALLAVAAVTFAHYGGRGAGRIRPYVQGLGGGIDCTATAPLSLTQRGWTTYRWRAPAVDIRRIGFEVDSAGTADLVIALDTVVW